MFASWSVFLSVAVLWTVCPCFIFKAKTRIWAKIKNDMCCRLETIKLLFCSSLGEKDWNHTEEAEGTSSHHLQSQENEQVCCLNRVEFSLVF